MQEIINEKLNKTIHLVFRLKIEDEDVKILFDTIGLVTISILLQVMQKTDLWKILILKH